MSQVHLNRNSPVVAGKMLCQNAFEDHPMELLTFGHIQHILIV